MSEKKKEEPTAIVVSNPDILLAKMIDKGADAEVVKKWMDIAKEMRAAQAEAAHASAMVRCQGKMPSIVRDGRNPQTKSGYGKIETILAAIVPIYTGEGLSICFTEEKSEVLGKVRFAAIVTHEMGHSKTYYRNASPDDGKGPKGGAAAMNAIQAEGSTNTYIRKMLMGQVFNLRFADEVDDDGAGSGNPGTLDQDQIKVINELLEDCRNEGQEVDYKRFLTWLLGDGVEGDLGNVPSTEFARTVDYLNRKIRKIRAKKAGAS